LIDLCILIYIPIQPDIVAQFLTNNTVQTFLYLYLYIYVSVWSRSIGHSL